MRRDWEVVREILLALERIGPGEALRSDQIQGRDAREVGYHFAIMREGGLIHMVAANSMNGAPDGIATRLTWDGHEFLDQIRNDTVWRKVKSVLAEKSLDGSFDILKELGTQIVRGMLS